MYNNDALIFEPVYIKKPWGGSKLTGKNGIGEAFLISDIDGSKTKHNNKTITELISNNEPKFLGDNIFNKYGEGLPIYMKELDATDNLSVQVHPDNEKAKQLENEKYGKSESWYILNSGESGGIYLGFKENVTKNVLKKALENSDDISKLLNFIPVKSGDFFYIPAGLVHAIGKNVHLLEPQQNSNRTYRVWDWNRLDENGESRELHVEKSLEVLNFEPKFNKQFSQNILPEGNKLLSSEYFDVEIYQTSSQTTLKKHASYRILTIISGEVDITFDDGNKTKLLPHKGCFIPAFVNEVKISANQDTEFLVTFPR